MTNWPKAQRLARPWLLLVRQRQLGLAQPQQRLAQRLAQSQQHLARPWLLLVCQRQLGLAQRLALQGQPQASQKAKDGPATQTSTHQILES